MQLAAAVAPATATNKTVTWSATGPASVSPAGLVTFTGAEGAVTITARAASGVVGTKLITVVKKVTKVATPLKTIYLIKKGKYTVPYALYDGTAEVTGTAITWTSSDKATVAVTAKGAISVPAKPKKAKATITGKTASGATIKITVNVAKKALKLKKVTAKGPKSLKVGKTGQITVKLSAAKATDVNAVTFKSSKAAGLAVDKAGKITAKKKGSYTVTVKAGKKSVKVKVTVK
jgi:uncharacterized protein YjdB